MSMCRAPFARIFVIYLSDELGGAKAACLLKDRVFKMQDFRKVAPPTKATAILNQLQIPSKTLDDALAETEVLSAIAVVGL